MKLMYIVHKLGRVEYNIMYNENNMDTNKRKRKSPSDDTKKKISAGVKRYHKRCKDNAARLAKLTKTTGKKKYFRDSMIYL